MRGFLYVLSTVAVIALAFWAYHENYETQEALNSNEELQGQIRDVRQRLRILRVEWAYLNRPERLRNLAEMNFDRLGLLPLTPEQFGKVDQVDYPKQKTLKINGVVDVNSANKDAEAGQ